MKRGAVSARIGSSRFCGSRSGREDSRSSLARKHGISEATIYNWKARYGVLEVSEAKRLKVLEDEICKLKKLLANRRDLCDGEARRRASRPDKARKSLKIMAIVDRHGLPLSVSTHAANHHEVRLYQASGSLTRSGLNEAGVAALRFVAELGVDLLPNLPSFIRSELRPFWIAGGWSFPAYSRRQAGCAVTIEQRNRGLLPYRPMGTFFVVVPSPILHLFLGIRKA